MGKLPNFEKSVIPTEKLAEYVLNPDHPDGQHKARVFKACLGIERHHAAAFGEIIRRGLERAPAQFAETTKWGDLWTTLHEVIGLQSQSVVITVGWLLKGNEPTIPTLVTCYIETGEQEKLRRFVASNRVSDDS